MNALRSASVLALFAAAIAASAQNLVVNPGFETGSFAGSFTKTPASSGSSFDVVPYTNPGYFPHAGTYYAVFGAYGGLPDTISQAIATVPGQRYQVSYYLLNNPSDQVTSPQSFTASFGGAGQTIGVTTSTYSLQSFFAVASSASTTLSFAGFNGSGFYLLDDVSVVATPEPSALAALGLGALAMLRRRKRA